jgi:hypothetical protein
MVAPLRDVARVHTGWDGCFDESIASRTPYWTFGATGAGVGAIVGGGILALTGVASDMGRWPREPPVP